MEESVGQIVIDLCFLTLCLRVVYIAVSRGMLRENFKVIGLLVASFLAFQYYPFFADSVYRKIPFLNKQYLSFISFLLIFLGILIIFSLVRSILTLFLRRDEISLGERWVLLFVGGFRAFFLSSVIIFLLYLSPLGTYHFSRTISYKIFKHAAPVVYLLSYKVYSKLNFEAKLNKEVQNYYEASRFLPESDKKGN